MNGFGFSFTESATGSLLQWVATGLVCIALFVGAKGPAAHAQSPDLGLGTSDRPIEVFVAPLYQQVSDGETEISSFSTRVGTTVPLGERTTLRGHINYAQLTAENQPTVSGLADAYLSAFHTIPFESSQLVVSVDTRLPTGTQELTSDAFATTVLTSQRPYRFAVPVLGQGWMVAPGITWVQVMSDRMSLGLGVSARYQGGYRPTANSAEDYVPGNEGELSLGIDYRLNDISTLALDLSGTYFGTDTEGDLDRFEARYNVSARAQYQWAPTYHALRIQARYENWPESRFVPVLLTQDGFDEGEPVGQQVLPSVMSMAVGYTARASSRAHLGGRVDVHHYAETTRFDATTVARVQATPRFRFDPVRLTPNVSYTLGDFSGFEAGLRTTVQF